jgi:peptidyl-prolyl cis-trans isomerase A (cyclophilin A)
MRTLLILAFVFIFIFIGCHKNHNPRVLISTQLGDIEAELYIDKAPVTAINFMKYVDSGKYNTNACFYRTVRMDNQPGKPVKIEVIQGGFYSDSVIEKIQFPPIRHETTKETGVLHLDGVLSMARNEPGTASSEFFICIGDQPNLDFGGKRNPDGQGFAAFGKVINGMDVVRKIQQLKDYDQYLENPVKITGIKRINND